MLKKTLQCLEGIHLSQSGSLLMLYVDKLLSTPFRVLARMVDTLACRRVEMLLAETLQVQLLSWFCENLWIISNGSLLLRRRSNILNLFYMEIFHLSKVLFTTMFGIYNLIMFYVLNQNSVAQLPLEELDRIQEYLQTSGLAQR